MKIIVITCFKVGSSALINILADPYNYLVNFETRDYCLSNYNGYERFVLRGHIWLNYELMNSKKFDIWFTMVRRPTDIYISGFFQDIAREQELYPYYFGTEEDVLNASTETLIDYFSKFDWNTFNQFSFEYNFKEILKYTNVDIWNEDFDVDKGYSIYYNKTKNIKVCVLTIEALKDVHKILAELNITAPHKNIKMDNEKINATEDKWCKYKYRDMKANMPQSYFEKYKSIDDKILNKFYIKQDPNQKKIMTYKALLESDVPNVDKYIACLNLNTFYSNIGDVNSGLKYLEESYNYDKKRGESIYHLIKHYMKHKDTHSALAHYKKVQHYYETQFLIDPTIEQAKEFSISAHHFYMPYNVIILSERLNIHSIGIKMFEIIFIKKYSKVDQWHVNNLIYNLQFFIDKIPPSNYVFKDLFSSYMDFLSSLHGITVDQTKIAAYKTALYKGNTL